MGKSIEQIADELIEALPLLPNRDNRSVITAALLTVAREQREACQAALGTVPQKVIDGVGMISTAAAAIRSAGGE